MALLTLLTLALAALTLGSFANLNPGAPLWLRAVGGAESLLSTRLGTGQLSAFERAVALTLLTSAVAALTAYLKPRA